MHFRFVAFSPVGSHLYSNAAMESCDQRCTVAFRYMLLFQVFYKGITLHSDISLSTKDAVETLWLSLINAEPAWQGLRWS